MCQELKDKLTELARIQKRDVSEYVRLLLQEHVEDVASGAREDVARAARAKHRGL